MFLKLSPNIAIYHLVGTELYQKLLIFELNDIWRYLTIIWQYLTTETFTLAPENYRPKDIVKYRHLSPSGNQTLFYVYWFTYPDMLKSLRGFLMISLFLESIRSLVNESSKSRYLEFSSGVILLSRSRAISKIALSQTFCPVPSEFEIGGPDCTWPMLAKTQYWWIYFF